MPTPGFNFSLIVIMTTLFSRSLSSHTACTTGWFGTGCKYKCWCPSNRCDSNGECASGIVCVTGWFGPSCQYNNLMTEATSDNLLVNDNNIETCTTGVPDITADFKDHYRFSWLRIIVNGTVLSPEAPPRIYLYFEGVSTNTEICAFKTVFIVDPSTADIHCNISTRINKITLSGLDSYRVCELFINGGRNLALKQRTSLNTVYTSGGFSFASDLAVDGSRDGYLHNRSCACTYPKGSIHTWFLYFPRSVLIYRALIFNRDIAEFRLAGFVLKVFDVNDTLVQTYREPGMNRSRYGVPFTFFKEVDKIRMDTPILLTLCEFETYGERICPRLKWGLDCLGECHCEANQLCSPVTGNCTLGCPPRLFGLLCYLICPMNCLGAQCTRDTGVCVACRKGYMGDYCDIDCSPDTYGKDCLFTCSSNCRNQSCDNSTIKIGAGSNCSERICDNDGWCYACNDTSYYGFNCTLKCPENCQNNTCDIEKGTCPSCKIRFYGDDCSKVCDNNCKDACDFKSGACNECNSTFYGEHCSLPCSIACAHNVCHPITGACTGCPNGFFGEDCSQICPKKCRKTICHITNGSCLNGCETGLFGTHCSNTCPEKCREQTCHVTHGSCSKGCELGLFGENCSNICARRCSKRDCDFNNGSCYTCDIGFYGLQCDFQCSDDCKSKICDIQTGFCFKDRFTNYHLEVVIPIASVFVIAVMAACLVWKYKSADMPEELDESHIIIPAVE